MKEYIKPQRACKARKYMTPAIVTVDIETDAILNMSDMNAFPSEPGRKSRRMEEDEMYIEMYLYDDDDE